MSWILGFFAVTCGWAMLRTMGSERERRVLQERQAAMPPPAPPPQLIIATTKPKKQKPVRRQAA
jgi:hypothetical protein